MLSTSALILSLGLEETMGSFKRLKAIENWERRLKKNNRTKALECLYRLRKTVIDHLTSTGQLPNFPSKEVNTIETEDVDDEELVTSEDDEDFPTKSKRPRNTCNRITSDDEDELEVIGNTAPDVMSGAESSEDEEVPGHRQKNRTRVLSSDSESEESEGEDTSMDGISEEETNSQSDRESTYSVRSTYSDRSDSEDNPIGSIPIIDLSNSMCLVHKNFQDSWRFDLRRFSYEGRPTEQGVALVYNMFGQIKRHSDDILDALETYGEKIGFQLHLGRHIYLTIVRKYPTIYMDIREYCTDHDPLEPTQKGVFLSHEDVIKFMSAVDRIYDLYGDFLEGRDMCDCSPHQRRIDRCGECTAPQRAGPSYAVIPRYNTFFSKHEC